MKKRVLFLIATLLLLLDQITKYIVSSNLEINEKIIVIDNFFKIYHIKNDGAAFSILSGKIYLFYIITALALVIVFYFYKNSTSKLSLIATTILLSGILGNFIDRLLFQEVTDFISLQFKSYHFAIFNFADMYISISVVLFFVDYFINERRDVNERNNS